VDLPWDEIKSSWEGFFGTTYELDFGVTKKSIQGALRDIPKLLTNETYPVNEINEWEGKFSYWLSLFDPADDIEVWVQLFLSILIHLYINTY